MRQEDLYGEITPKDLRDALDDARQGSGDPDVWESLLRMADERVTNALGKPPRPNTATPPQEGNSGQYVDASVYARKLFILEALFTRRGFFGSQNPFAQRARDAEKRLRDLASGADAPLDGAGAAHTEPLRATPKHGMMA